MYLYVLFRRQTRAYHTRIEWHREEQHDIGASLVLVSYKHCARRRGTRRAPNCAIVITGSHVCVFPCALVHEWCRTLIGWRVRIHRCPFRQPVSGSSVVHLLYSALSTWADGERQDSNPYFVHLAGRPRAGDMAYVDRVEVIVGRGNMFCRLSRI